MRKRVETVDITCDQCSRKIVKPMLGIKIRVGNCQPDHRIWVELHLMGDADLCRECLCDLVNHSKFVAFEDPTATFGGVVP